MRRARRGPHHDSSVAPGPQPGYRASFASRACGGPRVGPGKGPQLNRAGWLVVMMVDESVHEFWSQVADALRNRISSQDWCSWFAGSTATELGPERIVVEVVNDFAVRWV